MFEETREVIEIAPTARKNSRAIMYHQTACVLFSPRVTESYPFLVGA